MSNYITNFGNLIEQKIDEDSEDIKELLYLGSDDMSGDTTYSYSENIESSYKKNDLEINYNIKICITFMDFEKHKFEKKGQYNIQIICKMENSIILSDLKNDMTKFTNKLMPYKNVVVTQNYPNGSIKFDKDITEDEFRESFL